MSKSQSQLKTKDTMSNEVSVPQSQPQPNSKYIVLNELLSYTFCYRGRSSRPTDCIRRVLLNFYSPEVVSVTKKLLIKECVTAINNTAPTTERRSSTSRPASDAQNRRYHSISPQLAISCRLVLPRRSRHQFEILVTGP